MIKCIFEKSAHIMIFLGISVTMLWSCRTDNGMTLLPVGAEIQTMDLSMKLGEKLENPYSVTNMRKAMDSLQKISERVTEDTTIEATHYYVKFTPLDETELNILKDDTTLVLYDYPLDYEIPEGEGDYYHDPDIPEGQPTPQYSAVAVDYELPSLVGYEILEELFIPDDFSDESGEGGRVMQPERASKLVELSLAMTGNAREEEGGFNVYRPSGLIRVWDDQIGETLLPRQVFDGYECYDCATLAILPCDPPNSDPNGRSAPNVCQRATYRTESTLEQGSFVPLVGVEVRARRWFTTHKGFTNELGAYTCDGTFDNPANYSIKWERNHFSIRSGNFGQATYNGPKKTGTWSVNFGNAGATTRSNTTPSSFRQPMTITTVLALVWPALHATHR